MAEWYDQIKDKYVGNVANKYLQENPWTIFKAFPDVHVKQLSGYLATYDKEDWMRVGEPNDYVVSGADESKGDDFATGSSAYVLKTYKFHDDLDRDSMENYDSPFSAVRDRTQFVVNRLGLVMAKVFKNALMATSVWGKDVNCTAAKWSTAGTAVIKQVSDECRKIQAFTGRRPNRMIICQDAIDALEFNTQITARLKNTDTKIVTKNILASIFKLEMIQVLDAVESSVGKGGTATTANTDFMHTGSALLFYSPPSPSIRMPAAGYNLLKKGKLGKINTTTIPMKIKNDSIRIEGSVQAMPFVLGSDLGTYLYNLV